MVFPLCTSLDCLVRETFKLLLSRNLPARRKDTQYTLIPLQPKTPITGTPSTPYNQIPIQPGDTNYRDTRYILQHRALVEYIPLHHTPIPDPCSATPDPYPPTPDPCPSTPGPCPSTPDPCPSTPDPCPATPPCGSCPATPYPTSLFLLLHPVLQI